MTPCPCLMCHPCLLRYSWITMDFQIFYSFAAQNSEKTSSNWMTVDVLRFTSTKIIIMKTCCGNDRRMGWNSEKNLNVHTCAYKGWIFDIHIFRVRSSRLVLSKCKNSFSKKRAINEMKFWCHKRQLRRHLNAKCWKENF